MPQRVAVCIFGSLLVFAALSQHQTASAQRDDHPGQPKSAATYYPLAPGRTWTYQISMRAPLGTEATGTMTVTNLAARQLYGKTVTPQRAEGQLGGNSHFEVDYMTKDRNGVYEFAEQDSGDVEPMIKPAPDYTIKEPIRVGNSWPTTVDTPGGQSVPAKATIESIDETVDVPAGTFKGCVKVHVVGTAKGAAGIQQYFWFAPTVGMVRQILMAPYGSDSVMLVSFAPASKPSRPLAGEPPLVQSLPPPSDVIKAFFSAAKDGRCSEAMTYLSAGSLARIKATAGPIQLASAFELICNKYSVIDRIEILQHEVHGNRATVYFRVYSKGRESPVLHYSLIREQSKWKIILPE